MSDLATTRLSSKGQVVIPEEIRNHIGLKAGDLFIVFAEKDVVILKTISKPNLKHLNQMINKARKQAESAGLTKDAIDAAIKQARRSE